MGEFEAENNGLDFPLAGEGVTSVANTDHYLEIYSGFWNVLSQITCWVFLQTLGYDFPLALIATIRDEKVGKTTTKTFNDNSLTCTKTIQYSLFLLGPSMVMITVSYLD